MILKKREIVESKLNPTLSQTKNQQEWTRKYSIWTKSTHTKFKFKVLMFEKIVNDEHLEHFGVVT